MPNRIQSSFLEPLSARFPEENLYLPKEPEKKGLPQSYFRDTLASAREEKSNQKEEIEKAENNSVWNWIQNAWNSFCSFVTNTSTTIKEEVVNGVGGLLSPKLEEPSSIDYSALQPLIDEMIELLEKRLQEQDGDQEELVGTLENFDKTLQQLLKAMNTQKGIQEDLWKVHQQLANINLNQRKDLEKEKNQLIEDYLTNNKWLTAANWTNRAMTVANVLLLGTSLILGFATGGVSAAVGATLFAFSCAGAIGQGVTGITEASLEHRSNSFSADISKNDFASNKTRELIEDVTLTNMPGAMENIYNMLKELRQVLRREREATRQMQISG